MVRVRLAPAEDVRRISKLARVAGGFNCVQPSDQLLVEVAAFGQWPAFSQFGTKVAEPVPNITGRRKRIIRRLHAGDQGVTLLDDRVH